MSAKDNMGEQFIDVFHSSHSPTPPHDRPAYNYFDELLHKANTIGMYSDFEHMEKNNPEGDVIFTGSKEAAKERAKNDDWWESRTYMHRYKVPESMVRPETWADDMAQPNTTPVHAGASEKPQHELFETHPAPLELVTPESAIKFVNQFEDYGGLSYAIHKGAIKSGKIKYMGMRKLD